MTHIFKNYGPEQALQAASYIRENTAALNLTPEDLELPIGSIVLLGKTGTANPTLVRAVKKYIVPFKGQFHSYPLVLVDHPTSKELFKMQAPVPNILREGMVVVDGEVYFVKLEDLKRGIVRKSRKLPIPLKRTITYKDLIDGLACTPTSELPEEHFYSTASVARRRAAADIRDSSAEATLDSGEIGAPGRSVTSGSEESVDLDEELRLADLAFSEQVGSLYSHSNPEEEWQSPDYS
jgi:hypothetical protein